MSACLNIIIQYILFKIQNNAFNLYIPKTNLSQHKKAISKELRADFLIGLSLLRFYPDCLSFSGNWSNSQNNPFIFPSGKSSKQM